MTPQDSASYAFDLETGTVSLSGSPVPLTPKDFELALFLFRQAHQTWSREALLLNVWHTSAALETRTVDAHVARLLRALDLASGRTGWRLVSLVTQGYRLERIETADQGPLV